MIGSHSGLNIGAFFPGFYQVSSDNRGHPPTDSSLNRVNPSGAILYRGADSFSQSSSGAWYIDD